MNLTTFTSRATTGIVAVVAGFASYLHITTVARDAGEHGAVAAVLPLSIDGLILVGTLAMLDDKRDGRRPRLSARIAVGFGVVATLAANIASAEPTTTARLVAAVPPIAFLIAVEVLARRGEKATVGQCPTVAEGVVSTDTPALAADEGNGSEGVDDFNTPEPVISSDPWRYSTPVAADQGPSRSRESSGGREPVQPARVKPRSLTAADRVVAAHAKEPAATHERIAKLAKVSVSTVKRHRPSGSPSAPSSVMTVNGRVPELAGVTR